MKKGIYIPEIGLGIFYHHMKPIINILHLLLMLMLFPLTQSPPYKSVEKEIIILLILNLTVITLSAGISAFLEVDDNDYRFALWMVYFALTAPIFFVCGHLVYSSEIHKVNLAIACIAYTVVPLSNLLYLSMQGFATFLDD